MKLTIILGKEELAEALRDYCEREVNQEIGEKDIYISYISPTESSIEVEI